MSKLFIGGSNVRKSLGDLTELKLSIAEHGILGPLLVRPLKNKFEVVIGSRRYEAAKTLQSPLRRVPVIIKSLSDSEALVLSLVENIQRRDLELEEEAEGILKLMKRDPERFANARCVAERLGKSESAVRELLDAYDLTSKLRRKGMNIHAVRAPSEEQREHAKAIPLKHAGLVASALEADAIKTLPRREVERKTQEIVKAITPLREQDARKVVDQFKMFPKKSIGTIRAEALARRRGIQVNAYLAPRVAQALSEAVEVRHLSQEKLVAIAIEEWLVLKRFLKG